MVNLSRKHVVLLAALVLVGASSVPVPSTAALYGISFTGEITDSSNPDLVQKIITGLWTYETNLEVMSYTDENIIFHTIGDITYSYDGNTIAHGDFLSYGGPHGSAGMGTHLYSSSYNDLFLLSGKDDRYFDITSSNIYFQGSPSDPLFPYGPTLTPTSAQLNKSPNPTFNFYTNLYHDRENPSNHHPIDNAYFLEFSGNILSVDSAKEVQPVPEPGTLVLLGSGLAGLVGFGRSRFL